MAKPLINRKLSVISLFGAFLGVVVVVIGYYVKASYVSTIGLTIIPGVIVGFFVSLMTSEATADATSRALLESQEKAKARSDHLESLKNVLMAGESPVQVNFVRHLLNDPRNFNDVEKLQRKLLFDMKNHWPLIFEEFIEDKGIEDKDEKSIEESEDKIKDNAKLLASSLIADINSLITNDESAIIGFFQEGANISSIEKSSLTIAGNDFNNVAATIIDLVKSRNIPLFEFKDQTEARERVGKMLSDYFGTYFSVPEKGLPSSQTIYIGMIVRNILEKSSPTPVKKSLINVNETHKAVGPIMKVLLNSIYGSEYFGSIIDNSTEQLLLRMQIKESGNKVENGIRSILMTTYLPYDCNDYTGIKK